METDGVASDEPKVGVHVDDDLDINDVFDVTLDVHVAVDVSVDVNVKD